VPILKPNLFNGIIKYRLDRDCCSKVLIVDDEYFNIMSLEFLLKRFKTKTDYAFNGREALEKVHNKEVCKICGNQGYILYFLDVNMPIMDGL
jgi:CheY-like chemotaxis protein